LIGKLSQPKHQGRLAFQIDPDCLPYRITAHEHRLDDFFPHDGQRATPADQFLNLSVYPVAMLFLAFVPVSQSLHRVANEFLQTVSPCFRHKHTSHPTEILTPQLHEKFWGPVRKEPSVLQGKRQLAEQAPSLQGGEHGFRNRLVPPPSFRGSIDCGAGLLVGFCCFRA
jgi:hypothetical protein